MNYIYRIRCRILAEGILKTIQYLFCASYYCLREYLYEVYYDRKYSRKSLRGNCISLYKELGANDVYHTKYSAMPLIFRFVRIKKNDVLVDVGCGKGRIINYWLSRKLKNKIVGLELDPELARCTAQHFSRWRNVRIRSGDAIANLPKDGTIFYFYNPFCEEKVRAFEAALTAAYSEHQIKVIYYNPKSLQVFMNGNWKIRRINFERDLGIKRWGRINKYHELAIITKKQKQNTGS